jgi:hypothetical protein
MQKRQIQVIPFTEPQQKICEGKGQFLSLIIFSNNNPLQTLEIDKEVGA